MKSHCNLQIIAQLMLAEECDIQRLSLLYASFKIKLRQPQLPVPRFAPHFSTSTKLRWAFSRPCLYIAILCLGSFTPIPKKKLDRARIVFGKLFVLELDLMLKILHWRSIFVPGEHPLLRNQRRGNPGVCYFTTYLPLHSYSRDGRRNRPVSNANHSYTELQKRKDSKVGDMNLYWHWYRELWTLFESKWIEYVFGDHGERSSPNILFEEMLCSFSQHVSEAPTSLWRAPSLIWMISAWCGSTARCDVWCPTASSWVSWMYQKCTNQASSATSLRRLRRQSRRRFRWRTAQQDTQVFSSTCKCCKCQAWPLRWKWIVDDGWQWMRVDENEHNFWSTHLP